MEKLCWLVLGTVLGVALLGMTLLAGEGMPFGGCKIRCGLIMAGCIGLWTVGTLWDDGDRPPFQRITLVMCTSMGGMMPFVVASMVSHEMVERSYQVGVMTLLSIISYGFLRRW